MFQDRIQCRAVVNRQVPCGRGFLDSRY